MQALSQARALLAGWLGQSGAAAAVAPAAPSALDERLQRTLTALLQQAESRSPGDPRARRALCFSTGLEMKERGNTSFNAKNYTAAQREYELGLDGLKQLESVPQDEHPFFDESSGTSGGASARELDVLRQGLQVTLLSNRAEAFLRCAPAQPLEAAASARAALAIDPANQKAQRRLERALGVGDGSPRSSSTGGGDGPASGGGSKSSSSPQQNSYAHMPTWKLLLLRSWRDLRYGGPWHKGLVPWLKAANRQLLLSVIVSIALVLQLIFNRRGRIHGNVRRVRTAATIAMP